jgi:hypothetical protein
MTKWVIQLVEDPETGELVLPLTPDILKQAGWDIGDTLIWEEHDHGSWSLRKSEDATPDSTVK